MCIFYRCEGRKLITSPLLNKEYCIVLHCIVLYCMAGKGILSDVGNTATGLFLTKEVPYLGKKAVEMGRYYTSEML